MALETDQPAPKGPIIVLPEERRGQLAAKLDQYKDRMDQFQHPGLQLMLHSSAAYKARVLGTLLEAGQVDTFVLSLELAEELGDQFDPDVFDNACGVIKDYCETGGANTIGGSGLPEV